jgi:recombination protein RecT
MPIKTPTNVGAMTPKQQAVAKKQVTAIDYLNNEKFQQQLTAALPKFLDTDHFVRSAITEFRLNPALAECSVPSVLGYFMQAAACGLEPASMLGQCYPVPFNNKKTGQKEAQFICGYRGMLSIARRSGEIASVVAEVVHEKDEFSIEYGMEPKLIHKPFIDGDPGPMKGAYVVVRFKGEGIDPVIKYMPKSEIDKRRARSKAGSYGPWVTDYEEMAKKTVFRSVFKWLPISIEQIQATTTDGAVSRYNPDAKTNDIDDLVEVEFVAAEDDNRPDDAAVAAAVDEMAENMKN